MRKIKLAVLLSMIAAVATLAACATDSTVTAGKTLLALQKEIVAAHETCVVPCKSGIIAKTDCQKIEDITKKAAAKYDLAVDAVVLSSAEGTTISNNELKVYLTQALTDITTILTQYGLGGAK